jgi:hypothetical protein
MFCWGKIHSSEYQDMLGRWRYEAIEGVEPDCSHADRHWYQDFEERLARLHPGLHLGWDLRKRRFTIFKFSPEVERLKARNGHPPIGYVHNFLDIVLDCKELVLEPFEGGIKPRMVSRHPGDWVFHELNKSAPARFDPHGAWGSEQVTKFGEDAEAEVAAGVKEAAADYVADSMTLADKGNPAFVRTAVRVPKKSFEPCTS